jgi:DNA-directed RNA polymerase specialized sigma24 family protein
MSQERGSSDAASLDELPDSELARLAAAGEQRAFEAIIRRYGEDLSRFCATLSPDEPDELFAAAVRRAVPLLHAGDAEVPLGPWLFGLAHEEAGPEDEEEPAHVAPAHEADAPGDPRFARIMRLARTDRAIAMMAEVMSFAFDVIGGVLGLAGDSVEKALRGVREAVMVGISRSSPECEEIRPLLAREDLSADEQEAVDQHLERCPRCRQAQRTVDGLGPMLKRSLPKMTTAAMAFVLREALARAAVGGPSGSSGADRAAAAEEAHRKYLRRRSMAAGGVLGLLVVVAGLALSSGRLGDLTSSGMPESPSLVNSLLAVHELGLQPPAPRPPQRDCTGRARGCPKPPPCDTDCTPIAACPPGTTGAPPRCVPDGCPPGCVPPPKVCPPDCVPPPKVCPPHCVPLPVVCPPDCVPPPCRSPRVGSECVCPSGTVEPDCEPEPVVVSCPEHSIRQGERCVPELQPPSDLCDPHRHPHHHHGRPPHPAEPAEPVSASPPAPTPARPPAPAPESGRGNGHRRHGEDDDRAPHAGHSPQAPPPRPPSPTPAPAPAHEDSDGPDDDPRGPPHREHGGGPPHWAAEPNGRGRGRKRLVPHG